MKKVASVLLIILSIESLFISFFVAAELSSTHPSISSMDAMFYSSQYYWVYWLFMLVPIGGLIFGILLKKKGNIIIGAIFTTLLFLIGFVHLFSMTQYSTDPVYLENLETELELDFPDDYTITTNDWTKGKGPQTSDTNNLKKYDSIVQFSDSHELETFISNLDPDKWSSDINSFGNTPDVFVTWEVVDCEYLLLYCYETDSFTETVAVSQYNYVFFGLDKDTSSMHIMEFVRK